VTRIMILDDSDLQSRCLQQVLESADYQVVCVRHLMAARRLMRSFQPDLALIELGLWQGNGFSVAAALGNERMITVLMSARHQPADRYWARIRGIDHVLARPQPRAELLSMVAGYLDTGSMGRGSTC